MFIDSPRDYSRQHAIEKNNATSMVQIQKAKKELYADKNALGDTLRQKIAFLNIDKQRLTLTFSGKLNQPLTLNITVCETDSTLEKAATTTSKQTKSFKLDSASVLTAADKLTIDPETLEKRFKNFNDANYTIESFDFEQLGANLSIPYKDLTTLKNQAAYLLNDSVELIEPVDVPALVQHPKVEDKPKLSLLISDLKDLHLCDETDADIYFKLPESLKKGCTKHIELLVKHPRLIPWFPAVLIGKDYDESVKILEQVKPKRIVTNNTGIAYQAFEKGIEWIAGPFLNTTNSYALLTMKDSLNCAGTFISNEISQNQIRNITRPENFKLLYSIYHPILMMTSRQCFFQQTVGCNKPSIEDGCMLKCEKPPPLPMSKASPLP